jgi:dipeptidyl aminopeptidase/acylaminoacyl peptidase
MTDPISDFPAEIQALHQPTLRDMLALEVPIEAKVSPGGDRVAILVRTTHWNQNRYESICHVHDVAAGTTRPLHRSGSAEQVEWVGEDTLAVLRAGDGEDDKAQVWLYEGLVGDGWAVTDHKTGIEWFKPFAGGILFRGRQPKRKEKKARTDRFGSFTHVEQEDSAAALYYVGLAELREHEVQVKAATDDEAEELVPPVMEVSRLLDAPLSIQDVVASPTGDTVYLNCRQRDDLVYFRDTSAYRIELDAPAALAEYRQRERAKAEDVGDAREKPAASSTTAETEDLSYLGTITRLNLPRGAAVSGVSPDGSKLLVSHRGRDDKMYTRQDLWVIELEAALQAPDAAAFLQGMRNISASLDRQVLEQQWVESGIFGTYADGARMRVAAFGEDGTVTPLDLQGVYPFQGFHISATGRMGLVGTNASTFPEAYLAEPADNGAQWKVRRLSDFGRAAEGWDLGTVETIRWTSKDGTEIEGVLRKPTDFCPDRTYPLVFVVHGGPRWFSAEYLLAGEDIRYYPSVQFVNKDVLVLKPNYRGSLGRGQAFADLNVNNLGIGDLWDLESAIEHLVARGWVDRERVGCMGWSQGGYISAFAALRSDAFAAVSVGAGVSDWYTYHISNDIPDFTEDYLSGSPFRSRELYAQTAPISNIRNAKTPMLIQHGSDDRRVPLSNAMELYRGLKEMGVAVELFVFPGMGHPITQPRENHAVMHQNLAWFSHYLLGEELELE